jgi:hypothetical protein
LIPKDSAQPINMSSEPMNELLILQSWMDSSALIKLRLEAASFTLELWVNVTEAMPDRVVLTVLGDNIGKLIFDPRGATFLYQEPREADESIRSDVESKIVCTLSVLFPDGTNFLLYERRTDEEAG